MAKTDILRQIGEKGADIDAIVERIIDNNECLPKLIEALQTEKGPVKYAYEKVRRLSERQPKLLYSYFDVFTRLLDHENSFLKWGGIRTVANLTAVDTRKICFWYRHTKECTKRFPAFTDLIDKQPFWINTINDF